MALSRRRLLGGLLAALVVVGAGRPRLARGAAGAIRRVTVRNAARPFVGDRRGFATISPRSSGWPARAQSWTWSRSRPLDATLEVVSRNGVGVAGRLSSCRCRWPPGGNEIPWAPAPSLKPGSYILRLATARDVARTGARLGGRSCDRRRGDVQAAKRGARARRCVLSVQTDAPWLRVTLLRCGPEEGPTNSNYEMRGVQVGCAAADRPRRAGAGSRRRSRSRSTSWRAGSTQPGSKARPVTSGSRRSSFGPTLPTQRVAVVLPTTTWQAYNYYDRNGDGFGDTWYSLWAQKRIDLDPPPSPPWRARALSQLRRPVPPLARLTRPCRRHLRGRGHRRVPERRRRCARPTT